VAILNVLVRRVADGAFSQKMLERAILRGLAQQIDMNMVIDAWASATTAPLKAAWKAAMPALSRGDRADAIYDVKNTHPELYELVAWRYEAIDVDSTEAEVLRQQHAREEKDLAEIPSRPPVNPADYDRQVTGYLSAFADGDVDAFWKLLGPLFVDDDGMIRDEQRRDDITEAAGWRRLGEETREDLIDAAEIYLRLGDPQPEQWLIKEDVFFWPAYAGLRALKLLFNKRRTTFDRLDDVIWLKWAPIILRQRRYERSEDDDEFRQTALERIRSKAPDITRATAVAQLPFRLHRSDIDAARDRLGDLWDDDLDDALFAQLSRDDLDLEELIGVVEALVATGREDAREWAVARITSNVLLGDERQRNLALGLVGVLAAHAPRRLWDIITSIADNDPAQRVLLSRLTDRSESGWDAALEPTELAQLFGLLDRLFPRDLDAPEERFFHMTIEMQASIWRGHILERLVARGSSEAVAVIAQLEAQFDENGWIRRMRHRAQEELRRAVWAPPEPDAIVRMGSDDRRRHVPDAPALRRLVMEALNEISVEMRGTNALASFLWNTKPHRLPKDENEISNMLVTWLRGRIEGDKAIINREVQVNPRTAQSADRTDILVQATSPGGTPSSVVIEVKGAWNDDVMTAMDEQLAAKYLKPDLTDQGIYLVFWFSGEGWEDFGSRTEQIRRSRATRKDAEALTRLLEQKADDFSTARDVVIEALVLDGSVAWPARLSP
jgi:hypothetical protein